MFICVCLSICGLFNFYPQNERWESFFFIGGCEELSSVYREGVNARRRGNLLKMLLIKLCGNCRPCTFIEYMFCRGRKKLVDKMHELIHVHVKRTLKRFTTQLILLFIDVARCSMYTIYKNPAPCASILSLRLQCRKLKKVATPLDQDLIKTLPRQEMFFQQKHDKKPFLSKAFNKA